MNIRMISLESKGGKKSEYAPFILDDECVEKAASQYVDLNMPTGPDLSWAMVIDTMRNAYIAGVKELWEEMQKPILTVKGETELNK